MDRPLLAAGLRARPERQHRVARRSPPRSRRSCSARRPRPPRRAAARAPSARSWRCGSTTSTPAGGDPARPGLVRGRMRAEDDAGAEGAHRLEPALEDRRARRARPSARSPGRGSSADARPAPRPRAPRRTRRSSRRRRRSPGPGAIPCSSTASRAWSSFQTSSRSGMLVLDRLAGEVVPAPDEHRPTAARGARAALITSGSGPAEQAARDDQDGVDAQPVDRLDERSVGRDQLLDLAEARGRASSCTPAGSSKSAACAAIRLASRVADELQQAPRRPSASASARPGQLGSEVAGQIGRGAEDRHRVAAPLQRQLDGRDALAEAVGQTVGRGREDELGTGVEQLEEQRRQALHGRRAGDDEQARRPGFHRPTG